MKTKRKHSFKDWVMVTRPWGYALSVMPAVLALAYVYYLNSVESITVNWWFGILAIIASPILQAGGNMMSDYYDYKHNVDREETYGSSRMLVNKDFAPKEVYRFSIIMMVIGNLIGIYLMINLAAWYHLLWIGLVGAIGSYFYFFMKYRALGDWNIFVIYGLLISLGTYLVMTNQLGWEILLIAAAPGLLIVNVLHANNTRDIMHDSVVNIRTMAIVLGVKYSKVYYHFLGIGAFALVALTVVIGIQPVWVLLVFLAFPMQIIASKKMQTAQLDQPENIKRLDEFTAHLVMVFMLLQVAGNFIGGAL